MKSVIDQNLNEQGIYIHFNEEDITEAYAMIIGQKIVVMKMVFCISRLIFRTILIHLQKLYIFRSIKYILIYMSVNLMKIFTGKYVYLY